MYTVAVAHQGQSFPGSAFDKPLYRIPALGLTTTGRILAAFDVRQDWRDLPADFDIALRTSDDQGRTWSEARPLRQHTPGHGFGDASFITDPVTGRICCWYVGSTGESYFSAAADRPGLELWLSTSDDNGDTWTHRDLSHLRPGGVGGMFTSSGNGTVLADGRLVQPFVARIGEEDWAVCAVSADHGDTWVVGHPVGPGCDENKVLGLAVPPGSSSGLTSGAESAAVLMHARATPHRRQALSIDGGFSFSEPVPVPALVDPACNGGLVRVGPVLVATMCDDPTGRARLSIHLSLDDGESWGQAILVDDGAAAYSVACALDEKTVGLMWEADNYEQILFATITLGELGVRIDGSGRVSWSRDAVELIARTGVPGQAKPPVVHQNQVGKALMA